MNAAGLTARDRRALVAGVLVIVVLIGGVRGLPAWARWRAGVRAHAEEMLTHAAQTEAVLAGFSESLDTLEARSARLLEVGTSLLVGESPGAAAARLEHAVSEMARLSSVRLDAVEARVDTSGAPALPLVSLDARATADVTRLAALLHRLERGPALLSVRRLIVRPQQVDVAGDQVETLHVEITVVGLALARTELKGDRH